MEHIRPFQLLSAFFLAGALVGCGADSSPPVRPESEAEAKPETLRVALFNIWELSLDKLEAQPGEAPDVDLEELVRGRGGAEQVAAAVEIVQRVRPDVLVVQEIDQGPDDDPAAVAQVLAERLRRDEQGPGEGIDYPHVWAAPSNTGRLSHLDLDDDGHVATAEDVGTRAHGNDSFGFGTYPGQYSMAVLSRFPIDGDDARTFQRFLWKDLPGHHLEPGVVPEDVVGALRLSSKSHWDVPVHTGAEESSPRLRLLVSHPTPQGFDGVEDRNGRRNFDEIRFWSLYVDRDPEASADLVDDEGVPGGYDSSAAEDERFVIVGDLNAAPDTTPDTSPGATGSLYDGRTAISQLLEHPRIRDSGPWTTSPGGVEAGQGADLEHPERSTATFGSGRRIDYVLPEEGLAIAEGGVFWPAGAQDPEGAKLAQRASDHRLVWLDLVIPSGS